MRVTLYGKHKAVTSKTIQFSKIIPHEMYEELRVPHLREQVTHTSAEARADLQKAIVELEKKKVLANKKAEDIHSATASSWEQAKSKTEAMMDDLRDSLTRARSYLLSR